MHDVIIFRDSPYTVLFFCSHPSPPTLEQLPVIQHVLFNLIVKINFVNCEHRVHAILKHFTPFFGSMTCVDCCFELQSTNGLVIVIHLLFYKTIKRKLSTCHVQMAHLIRYLSSPSYDNNHSYSSHLSDLCIWDTSFSSLETSYPRTLQPGNRASSALLSVFIGYGS